MKKRNGKKEEWLVPKEISKTNVRDLIAPFLYQIGEVKHSDEILDLELTSSKNKNMYNMVILIKKGGVNDSKELSNA